MFLLGVSEESNDNRVGFMIIEKNFNFSVKKRKKEIHVFKL